MATLRPTFSESWYRVADLKARLRPSAQISRQHYRGDRWYVVRDPAGNQFHRLSAPAYRFVGLLDGTRTVAEAWDLVGGQLADDAPTQNEVIQILSQLHAANLLESDVTPDAAVLLRRHKKQTKQKWQGRMMNILFPRIPLWDPDRFLVRWMPLMRGFLSMWGAILWLVVMIAAIVAIAPEWPRLQAAARDSIHPQNWPFLWATFVIIKLIHELGHGFTCRRFGGEVHELGIMFLVLVPAPYVDASSAWAFPNKWHKLLVGAGGMIFELFVAAIMAFVWLNTTPGTLVHQLAYNVMLIASVSTVIFNANPLLRYDGYYMLSDYLEIPNLRYRSGEYSLGLIKRHLFGVKQHQPLPPVRQRFWLLNYWIFSGLYRTWIGVMIILMVWNEVPVLGVLMALGGLITWLVVPVVKVFKYLTLEPELHRKRTRAWGWTLGAVAGATAFLWLVPWPTTLNADGIVEPAEKRIVFSEMPGVVRRIEVKDGQLVKKGDVLLVCESKELEMRLRQTEERLRGLMIRLHSAASESERLIVREQQRAHETFRQDLLDKVGKLTVRAPIDGKVISPQLHNLIGRHIDPGSEIAMVAKDDRLRIAAVIDQDDAALTYSELDLGKEAHVRMISDVNRNGLMARIEQFIGAGSDAASAPRRPVSVMEIPPQLTHLGGGPFAVDPSDPDGKRLLRPVVALWLELDNDQSHYLPGQRAYVRFDLKKRSLGEQGMRRLWQLIQAHSNSKWM